MAETAVQPISPCTAVCRIDPTTGLCLGCARTLAEIAEWSAMTVQGRLDVLVKVAARRAPPNPTD